MRGRLARRVRRAGTGKPTAETLHGAPSPTQQIQALDRTQPSLPMVRGRAGTMTHDYKRHGITDLFAALNVATGEVIADCRPRHAGADVLAFFKLIDKQVPRSLDIHVVLDNLSAHTAPEVTAWLAHPRRARWHLRFAPTSSSWLNLVERWFKQLTDRRLRRGVFTSVPHLTETIMTWVGHGNANPTPFTWHAKAEDIIAKVRRGRTTLTQVKIKDAALGGRRTVPSAPRRKLWRSRATA